VKRRYGKDWKLVCALLAAVSARSTVSATARLADIAYWQIKTTGTVKRESFIYAHYKSIQGVLKNGQPNGRKCRALYQNLIGNEQFVPVDIWLMRLFGITNKDRPNKSEYDLIERTIRADANIRGLTVAQRQAELWCGVRGKSDDFGDYLAQLKLF
jgi:hypothetical protein